MHISNLVGQYQKNTSTNSTEELKGATSMQKLVSTVRELTQGSVFEGTVTSVRGGRVMLSLSTGQTILAQLDGKVPLTIGLPMFFQVKGNDGGVLSIKPYNGNGSGGNPILMNALTSAGVPVTERNLDMVKAMMQQQMPINKQSILDMIKVVSSNEQVSVQTIVDMTRLGLPVDEELAAQFENYGKSDHALLSKMDAAIDQVLDILGNEEVFPNKSVEINNKLVDMILNPNLATQSAADDVEGLLYGNSAGRGMAGELAGMGANSGQAGVTIELHTQFGPNGNSGQIPTANQTLQQVFTEEQIAQLTKLMQSTPSLVDNQGLFITESEEEIFVDTMQEENAPTTNSEIVEEGEVPVKQVLNTDLTVEKFLKLIQQSLLEKQEFGFTGVQKLFGSKEYQTLLKNIMEEQWLIRPEELKDGAQVKESYEKLLRQSGQLEQIIRSSGLEQPQFFQNIASVQSNVEFMNQLNQLYTYVQLPLKLSGQDANGDLYVYTNKKNLNDPDAELSAFLHLDLDNLGSTDVSVKMQRKSVKTNFYFSDDGSYELVQRHLPILEAKLKQKGYHCTFTVTNEKKEMDFVQDFLRRDYPMTGELHRYSFDVRT